MVYLLSAFFIILAAFNLIKGRDVVIKTGINRMDIISIGLVVLIFLVFAYFIKPDILQTLAMAISIIIYMLTTRYARGVSKTGVVISGGSPLILNEYPFNKISKVNVSNDEDLVSFAVVIKDRNFVDIQRYKKELKPDLVRIFKDENVEIIYK